MHSIQNICPGRSLRQLVQGSTDAVAYTFEFDEFRVLPYSLGLCGARKVGVIWPTIYSKYIKKKNERINFNKYHQLLNIKF